ncbi:hypothetical protein BDV93DRAFT_612022 [Ceratobasidium sp. AG-I]|nr:hypothetical protein BDV93DRAFT_612022 [Ceratobasidium sp. AG-I]
MSLKYMPPDLPSYLANTFELKPIIGVPTDDEVKTIHAVIRATEAAAQVPAWNNPDLSMELTQHLFDVQMARHREKYPVSIFPSTNTYTPPTIPSHIHISLEPVTGAPTDDEVKLVHSALRTSEDLIKLPSVFDPDLSMNLSQHLFDIQFARYIQRTTEGRYTSSNTTPDEVPNRYVPAEEIENTQTLRESSSGIEPAVAQEHIQRSLFAGFEHEGDPGMTTPHRNPSGESSVAIALLENTRDRIEQMKINKAQTDQLLAGLNDTLVDGLKSALKDTVEAAVGNITQVMIKLHNHSARGLNSGHDLVYHHVVNDDAEAPIMYEVPRYNDCSGYGFWNNASDKVLVEYLKFYNIGTELFEQGDTLALKPVPALNDPSLSMELAQHLFDVQIARYREKYPVNIFPSTNTYIPPTLPSYINVQLEPINGAPSDNKVKLVHAALRASENMANLPSLFDPDLTLYTIPYNSTEYREFLQKLSQHLFDIQFARYIQRDTEGHYAVQGVSPGARTNPDVEALYMPAVPGRMRRILVEAGSEREQPELADDGNPAPHDAHFVAPDVPSNTVNLSEDARGVIQQLKVNIDQTDRRLAELSDVLKDALKDGLENVTQLMVKLHNHSARGFNSGSDQMYHHIVDENGEAPLCYLPWGTSAGGYQFWSNATDNNLAESLQGYKIGLELVEQGNIPSIKPGTKDEALRILGRHTFSRAL